ncbi:MAG: hypothetical protein ACXW3R_08240 [Rhodoplanes sp.]
MWVVVKSRGIFSIQIPEAPVFGCERNAAAWASEFLGQNPDRFIKGARSLPQSDPVAIIAMFKDNRVHGRIAYWSSLKAS